MCMQPSTCMQPKSRTIRVLFLKPGPKEHWFNRLVAYVDGPFFHVELDLDSVTTGQLQVLATSIYANETVFLKPRTFANPQYEIISINITTIQFDKLHAFCKNACESNIGYNGCALYATFMPCLTPLCTSNKTTFCSEYITKALQHAGIKETLQLNPAHVTPSSLHRILCKTTSQCFSTVPYKAEQIYTLALM